MKRLIPLLLVFVLLLGGCVTENTVHKPFETVADRQSVVVQYDVGSTKSGTVTAENGDVYRFADVTNETNHARYYSVIYPDGNSALLSVVGNRLDEISITPAKNYVAPDALLNAILDARPLHLPDVWLLLTVSLALIIAGIGTIFIPRGLIAMFSAPKGLTPLAVKQLVQMEPSDRKTGSTFYRIAGAVIAAGGVVLLIVTLL